MIVRGVVVPPQLGAGQREVPKLVDEAPHSLLLGLQPLVVAVACLRERQEWVVELFLL